VEVSLRRSEPFHFGPGLSVEIDWLGSLPDAHLAAFNTTSKELESSFGMFAVSLNEAVTLYRDGFLALSFEQALLTSGLCLRFYRNLDSVLLSLSKHTDAHGTNPSVASLEPADYQSQHGLRAALASSLWSVAAFSQHKKFVNKVEALRAMVRHIGNDVCTSADLIGSRGATIAPEPQWLTINEGYWDLNTCLRETTVSLKCFLRVLPDDQLSAFQDSIANRKARTARVGQTRCSERALAELTPD
jgi:hypothetical protein